MSIIFEGGERGEIGLTLSNRPLHVQGDLGLCQHLQPPCRRESSLLEEFPSRLLMSRHGDLEEGDDVNGCALCLDVFGDLGCGWWS